MTFSEYLIKNRIKEDEFAAGDPVRYAHWQTMYEHMHVNSFYISVKMVLNDVRNAYHLRELPKTEKPAATESSRPVVRRAAAAGSATQPASEAAQHDQPPASQPNLKANQPAIPGRRAVIRKPATEPEQSQEPSSEPAMPKNTASTAEKTTSKETDAPKPARARPVFKRASAEATPESSTETKPESNQTTENPAPIAPTPGRARPVFKRPENPATESSAEAASKPGATEPASAEARPARARPVFKRPDVAAAPPEQKLNAETEKDEAQAGEAKSEGASAEPEVKPAPRPRPVFRRPATEPSPDIAEAGNKLTNPETAKNKAASQENVPAEPMPETGNEEQKPKPPRARPVFKRPPSDSGQPNPEPAAE